MFKSVFPKQSAWAGLFPNSIQLAGLLKLVGETQIDEVAGLGLRRLGRILANFVQRRLDRFGANIEAAIDDRPVHLILGLRLELGQCVITRPGPTDGPNLI